MSFEEGSRTSKMMGRVLNFRVGSLVIVGFTILIALLSLGIAAAIGAVFGDAMAVQFGQTGQVFESVAAVFSGLAFIALVVTFLLQLEELKLQRSELGDQKAELHRTAEAAIRMLHVQLIKMSIDDPALTPVWPTVTPVPDSDELKQYQYINLIIQHHWLMLTLGPYRNEDIKQALRQLFTSPLVRKYWMSMAPFRRASIGPGSAEAVFTALVDDVFNEHDEPRP